MKHFPGAISNGPVPGTLKPPKMKRKSAARPADQLILFLMLSPMRRREHV
jgi:hypothetical protein